MKQGVQSGQNPFIFSLREDLDNVPSTAQNSVTNLHGGFAMDTRQGFGQIYYGIPGSGLVRIDADLERQSIIQLPDQLNNLNFHSTKIGEFDGKQRLFLVANDNEMVVVLSLGTVTFSDKVDAYGNTDIKEARRLVDICLENGLNMFDSANSYSGVLPKRSWGRRSKVAATT
jgi:hypothetical protein